MLRAAPVLLAVVLSLTGLLLGVQQASRWEDAAWGRSVRLVALND